MQTAILDHIASQKQGICHLVLEHFSFEMQYLLDDFMSGKISLKELLKTYKQIDTEWHDLTAYKRLLKHAKANASKVKLHAGVMPWPVAVISLRAVSASLGINQALRLAKARRYISLTENGRGTKNHFNIFESFITGRNH